MKYRLSFQPIAPVVLPVQYYKIMQASILSWLDSENYGKFLHDEGYSHSKRVFKNYTFSHIYGEHSYNRDDKKVIYTGRVYFYLSFYTDESHETIIKNLEEGKPLYLGNVKLNLEGIEIACEEYCDCVVDAVSPVTIHSTFEFPDGRKKTYYYEPWEKDFSRMIRENLVRKYTAINKYEPEDDFFEIKPVNKEKLKRHVIYYNRFIIKGWTGRFEIRGSAEMIEMALLAGIGSRNSIGMGCVLQRNDM